MTRATRLTARRIAACALAVLSTAATAASQDALDPSLRETVHEVPVAAAGTRIVVTSYRPRGDGPFPWIVYSHGTAPVRERNFAIGRNRNPDLMRQWTSRGYAVLTPIRRGYGATGGDTFGDAYGSCSRPDFRRAGEGAALDLLATVEFARTQRDLDPQRWLLVGQSAGGFASIYTASKRPPGLHAVLAFAPGRGGDPERRPGEPCASDRLGDLFEAIAPQIAVPVLWFYAENDAYIGPRVQKLWYGRFKAGGGRGDLVVIPPWPERLGHGVVVSRNAVPLWTAAVQAFYKAHGITLPF